MTSRAERRVLWPVLCALLAIAVLTASGVVLARAHDRGDLNTFLCDGPCGPAYVAAPDGIATTGPASASPSPAPTAAASPDAVAAAVGSALGAPELGPHVGVSVRELAGQEVFASGSGVFVPASTTKLLTGFAALRAIDPQQRFATRVVADGSSLVLVGGGDPYLAAEPPEPARHAVRADLATLADRTVEALRSTGTTAVTLGYDASLFSGPTGSDRWEPSYLAQDIVTPIGALWIDRGVHGGLRDDDPAAVAAERFAVLLRDRGLTVDAVVRPATATPAAAELASVRSATLAQIVEHLVLASDNEATEVVLRHVALARGEVPTFDGGVAAVRAVLTEAGIEAAGLDLHDGSGLSRANRIGPATLTDLVVRAAAAPSTARLFADLPVGGFSGTLGGRFDAGAAGRGLVRAKTGTLTGVHSLAGLVTTADGVTLAFAVMTDGTEELPALGTQAAIDRIADALAACACAG